MLIKQNTLERKERKNTKKQQEKDLSPSRESLLSLTLWIEDLELAEGILCKIFNNSSFFTFFFFSSYKNLNKIIFFSKEVQKGGAGRSNWGTFQDDTKDEGDKLIEKPALEVVEGEEASISPAKEGN